jgi:hypothetical protein
MSILSDRNKNKLGIFEKFKINKDLPKYKDIPEAEVSAQNSGRNRNMNTAVYTSGTVFSTTGTTTSTISGNNGSSTIFVTHQNAREGDVDNAAAYPLAEKDQGVTGDDIVLTFSEFFSYVRYNNGFSNMLSNLRYKRKIKALEKMLIQCEELGQISLKDLTIAELDRIKLEYILASHKVREFVDEENLVNAFKLLSKENQDLIELEWLSDFNRLVPRKIIERKKKIDKYHVFDNYVVLHIRPGWYGDEIERVSQAEADKRKDPILFGVMNCSRRLYYIGDWIDTECNLTLGELINKMGDSGLVVNEIWSRTDPAIPFEGMKKFSQPRLEKVIK